MSDVTRILSQIEAGDPQAAEKLLPLVYDELRSLAAAKLDKEKPGQTLQATALVHEAYLRLVSTKDVETWDNRGHFFAAAAEAMRRIMIEAARRKQSQRGGGHLQRHSLSSVIVADLQTPDDVLVLDAALKKLASIDKPAADVVDLRFFAGLPLPEVAKLLDISPRTADRLWAYAKAWLHREMTEIRRDGQDSRSIVA
jgi:RNA polymerase sigma factor (TIGR02999 family)